MDEQRIDVLYKQARSMDSSLIDMLDNYKKYSESTQPVVTVLCTDNKLRQDMDMLFSSRSDVIAKVYGTYDEQAKENEYNTLLSDVVVVCTKAKTISPKQCQQLKRNWHLPRIKNQIEYLGQNTLR